MNEKYPLNVPQKVDKIRRIIGRKRKIGLLCHNNPDPDSLGSAFGLQHLFYQLFQKKADILYAGYIGRAENREFMKRLHITANKVVEEDLARYSIICMVDTQPWTGNSILPPHRVPDIVFDHHFVRPTSRKVPFREIIPDVGSTATIVSLYCKELNLIPPANVATALFYGLKTDTANLTRTAGAEDLEAFNFLFPQVTMKTLGIIENPPFPRSYLEKFWHAVATAKRLRDVVLVNMETILSPDMVAELADFLLRIENIRWTFCVGQFENTLYISLRTSRRGYSAGEIASRILQGIGTGGGHEKTAGGQVKLDSLGTQSDKEQIIQNIFCRFLKHVDLDVKGFHPLIQLPNNPEPT